MADPQIPVETTGGSRSPSSAGERVLVGLAALTLMAGMLIAVGNAVGNAVGGATSRVSGEPTPSAVDRAARSPRPTEPPREMAVVRREGGIALPGLNAEEWVRATREIGVHSLPRPSAADVGVVHPGEAMKVLSDRNGPGATAWLHIVTADLSGWISTVEDDGSSLVPIKVPPAPTSWDVPTLAAGPQGFVAVGRSTGEESSIRVWFSVDGIAWENTNAAVDGPHVDVAWGPAGWLLLSSGLGSAGVPSWIWWSADGRSWLRLGALPLPAVSSPTQLVASETGYMLAVMQRYGDFSFWLSTDGLAWRESDAPGFSTDDSVSIAPLLGGFLARQQTGSSPIADAAFSADGVTWSPVVGGPQGPGARISELDGVVMAIDGTPGSGVARSWTAARHGHRLQWRRLDDDLELVGGVITALARNGDTMLAFGWEEESERILTWSNDGHGWRSDDSSLTGFGGIPRVAAGGVMGTVLVGYRPGLFGQNPVFWHRDDAGAWRPEPMPIVPLAKPKQSACASPPVDWIEMILIDPSTAAWCFGGQPMTFRAWSGSCGACGHPTRSQEPSWLSEWSGRALALSPLAGDGPSRTAVVHPSLGIDGDALDLHWRNRWVEVTGHFDDPAAGACRSPVDPDQLTDYQGRQWTIDECRRQFVITAMRPIEGPEPFN
jgi:hypothetical protein